MHRHKLRVHRFVTWDQRVGTKDAEDVTQEVFIAAFTSARKFKAKSSVKTWLYSVAKNTISNWHRAQRRHQQGRQELDDGLVELSGIPQPDREEQLRRSLDQALTFLVQHNEDLAQTLMLREWEGLSYEDIAQVMQIPIGTVRSRLHSARKLLMEQVDHEL